MARIALAVLLCCIVGGVAGASCAETLKACKEQRLPDDVDDDGLPEFYNTNSESANGCEAYANGWTEGSYCAGCYPDLTEPQVHVVHAGFGNFAARGPFQQERWNSPQPCSQTKRSKSGS